MYCIYNIEYRMYRYAIPKFQMVPENDTKRNRRFRLWKTTFLGYMLNLGSAVTFASPEYEIEVVSKRTMKLRPGRIGGASTLG